MSARDAQTRLSHRFRKAQAANDRPTAFRVGDDALPRWPADAFDRPHGLERVTVPPGNDHRLVCDNFPECGCDADCHDAPQPLTQEQLVLLIVLFAISIAGLGIIYLAVR